MEALSAYTALLVKRSRKRSYEAMLRRKREAIRRRKQFARRQTQQRFAFLLIMSVTAVHIHSPIRTVWSKERSSYWWEQIVGRTFTSQDWLENFRMSRATFMYLCNELRLAIERDDTTMRKAIPTEQRDALTLWFLATNADYRTIGHLFGVSKSTICVITKDVCAAIVRKLLVKYIRIPTGDGLKEVVDGFKHKWEFPQCAGSVDGTHIPIVSPEECPADYYNRKGWHSILMQGVVNHLGHFTDIYVGWPGRVHDARVFSNSTLYQKGQDGTLFPDWKESIAGTDVPLVLLGDPAYPLLPWLMKAFPDNGHLSRQQRNFNYRLSSARVTVEHAYGRLKGRWRCLLKRLDVHVSDVPELVAACCVLHNVCEIHGEHFDEEWMEGVQDDSITVNSTPTTTQAGSGQNTRQALMTYFHEE